MLGRRMSGPCPGRGHGEGVRMKSTYRILAYLIALLVVVQAGAIAWAFFGMTDWITNDNGVVDKALLECDDCDQEFTAEWGFAIHMFFVGLLLIPLTSLLLLIVSFFAKVPGGVKWAGFTLLAIIVQVVLGLISFSIGGLGALHGINAFVVFGVAAYTSRRVALAEDATAGRAATATV